LPTTIAVNFLIRIPIVWFFTSVIPVLTGTENVDIRYSWLAIVLIGVRENLATMGTLYAALKLIEKRKKIALYVGSVISISIVVLMTLNYPIRFSEIGFWNSVGELALLVAQGFGVYKAITCIKEEFYYEIHNL
jgi:hypothetical protein